MPRPKQTIPSVQLNLALPAPLMDRLTLELYSELEGKVPVGAFKLFFTNLLEAHFEAQANPCPACRGTGGKAAV